MIPRDKIKGILFDMDGVLIDSMRYHTESFQNIFKELNMEVDPIEIYKREGQKSKEIFQQIFDLKDVEISAEELEDLVKKRRRIFREIENTKPYHEIQEIIPALKLRYKLGVVSGSNRETVNKFINKEYKNMFDAVITGDDVENTKPNPEPFKKGSKILNLKEDEIVVIENSPLGIKSVKETEMYCIAVSSYLPVKYLSKARKTFKNHKELKKYLENEFLNN